MDKHASGHACASTGAGFGSGTCDVHQVLASLLDMDISQPLQAQWVLCQ